MGDGAPTYGQWQGEDSRVEGHDGQDQQDTQHHQPHAELIPSRIAVSREIELHSRVGMRESHLYMHLHVTNPDVMLGRPDFVNDP